MTIEKQNTDSASQLLLVRNFLQSRFSPEGILGLHLTLGSLVLIGATWLFAAIAEDVVNRESLTDLDVKVNNAIHTHASVPLTYTLLFITNLHSTIGVSLISLVLTVYFLRSRQRYWALAFVISICGGMALNVLLKNLFHRARPHFDDQILTLTSYGFPSGHTMMATTLYGFLCVYIVSRVRSWLWRALAMVISVILIFLVGFSRIYLGAHYLSDVLAAILEGFAWLALCLTAVYTMRRWREQRQN